MTRDEQDQIGQRLSMIMQDALDDAQTLDGQPFNGRTVATNLGQILASIHALAATMRQILDTVHIDNSDDEAAAYEAAMSWDAYGSS